MSPEKSPPPKNFPQPKGQKPEVIPDGGERVIDIIPDPWERLVDEDIAPLEPELSRLEKIFPEAERCGALLVVGHELAKKAGLKPQDAPGAIAEILADKDVQNMNLWAFVESIDQSQQDTSSESARSFLASLFSTWRPVLEAHLRKNKGSIGRLMVGDAHTILNQYTLPAYRMAREIHGKKFAEIDPRNILRAITQAQASLEIPLTENENTKSSLAELHPELKGKEQEFLLFCQEYCAGVILNPNLTAVSLPLEAQRDSHSGIFIQALANLSRKLQGDFLPFLQQFGFREKYTAMAESPDGNVVLGSHWEFDDRHLIKEAVQGLPVTEALKLYGHLCQIRAESGGSLPKETTAISSPYPPLAIQMILLRTTLSAMPKEVGRAVLHQYLENVSTLRLPPESKSAFKAYADLVNERGWEDYLAWNEDELSRRIRDILGVFLEQHPGVIAAEAGGLAASALGLALYLRRRSNALLLKELLSTTTEQDSDKKLALYQTLAKKLKIPLECVRAITGNPKIMRSVELRLDRNQGVNAQVADVRTLAKIFQKMFPDDRNYREYAQATEGGLALGVNEIVKIIIEKEGEVTLETGELKWQENGQEQTRNILVRRRR